MLFFVVTRGSPADEDEWWSCGLDCEPESVTRGPALALPGQLRARPAVGVTPTAWPRAGSARPQEHPLPDALRLLEYLVDACEAY